MNLIGKVINSVEEGVRRVKKASKAENEGIQKMKLNSQVRITFFSKGACECLFFICNTRISV